MKYRELPRHRSKTSGADTEKMRGKYFIRALKSKALPPLHSEVSATAMPKTTGKYFTGAEK